MKEINTAIMPTGIVLAHREGRKGEEIVEAWHLEKQGGMRYLTEFKNVKIVYKPSNSLDIERGGGI